MALVLIEEVLMGLEQAKDSLEQSVVTLSTLTEDLTPDLIHPWKEVIETELLRPLEKRVAMLDTLLEEMAAQVAHAQYHVGRCTALGSIETSAYSQTSSVVRKWLKSF